MPVRLTLTARLIAGATGSLRRRIRAYTVRGKRSECWRWTGPTRRRRDGALRPAIQVGGRGSRKVTIARLLLVFRDRVPLAERDAAKLEAGHDCHHYWCVNPWHLLWQTRIENEAHKKERNDFEDFARDVDDLAAEAAGEATC